MLTEQSETAPCLPVSSRPPVVELATTSQNPRPADYQRVQGGLAALVPRSESRGRQENHILQLCRKLLPWNSELTQSDQTTLSSSSLFVCFPRCLLMTWSNCLLTYLYSSYWHFGCVCEHWKSKKCFLVGGQQSFFWFWSCSHVDVFTDLMSGSEPADSRLSKLWASLLEAARCREGAECS